MKGEAEGELGPHAPRDAVAGGGPEARRHGGLVGGFDEAEPGVGVVPLQRDLDDLAVLVDQHGEDDLGRDTPETGALGVLRLGLRDQPRRRHAGLAGPDHVAARHGLEGLCALGRGARGGGAAGGGPRGWGWGWSRAAGAATVAAGRAGEPGGPACRAMVRTVGGAGGTAPVERAVESGEGTPPAERAVARAGETAPVTAAPPTGPPAAPAAALRPC